MKTIFRSKSGYQAPVEVIGVFILILGAIIFAVKILPGLISDLYGQLALFSAEVVARDLAGLITISAAAPNEIVIENAFSESYEYDASINDRIVWVKLLTTRYGMKGQANAKIAIDGLDYKTDEPVNYFVISKSVNKTGNVYDVDADLFKNG